MCLRDRFHTHHIHLQIPDLNQGDFLHLTLSRQLQQVEQTLNLTNERFTLIGSSLGGLTATWLAQRQTQVERLICLAPAFDFLDHWLPHLGADTVQQWKNQEVLSIYHYAAQKHLPIRYQFIEDLGHYPTPALTRPLPTLILHGKKDMVIPINASREYTHQRDWTRLVELESDHALGDVLPRIWQEIQAFCQI